MLRRAIPLVFALCFSYWAFPHHWVMSDCDAAPVPSAPKADDEVSASGQKLLKERKVQKELKLSAEQRLVIIDGLADLQDWYADKLIELLGVPNLPNDAIAKFDKEKQKKLDKLLADATAKTLTAPQRVRLQQLDWRVRGPGAFADQRVEQKLQLTDAQKKKVAEVSERMKGEFDRFINARLNGEDEAKHKSALFKFRTAQLKELEEALSADQKTAWGNMLGAAPTGFVADELWLKFEEEADALAEEPTAGKGP
jgi:hypothetical protein